LTTSSPVAPKEKFNMTPQTTPTETAVAPSPLMMCDRLLTLAKDADRAGFAVTAEHLLHLAHVVLDEKRPN
jgi:hypothetical protein